MIHKFAFIQIFCFYPNHLSKGVFPMCGQDNVSPIITNFGKILCPSDSFLKLTWKVPTKTCEGSILDICRPHLLFPQCWRCCHMREVAGSTPGLDSLKDNIFIIETGMTGKAPKKTKPYSFPYTRARLRWMVHHESMLYLGVRIHHKVSTITKVEDGRSHSALKTYKVPWGIWESQRRW
jgi:hypothetical protein